MSVARTLHLLFLAAFFLSGCAIKTQVVGPDQPLPVDRLYIKRNFDTRLDPVLGMIREKLEAKGIPYEVVNSEIPEGGQYHLEYTARWNWDLVDYLSRFQLSLYKNGRIIAGGEYNATTGGANPAKFKDSEKKIEPVIDSLIANLTTL